MIIPWDTGHKLGLMLLIVASIPLTPAMVSGGSWDSRHPQAEMTQQRPFFWAVVLIPGAITITWRDFWMLILISPSDQLDQNPWGWDFVSQAFLFVFLHALLYEELLISLANSEHKILWDATQSKYLLVTIHGGALFFPRSISRINYASLNL